MLEANRRTFLRGAVAAAAVTAAGGSPAFAATTRHPAVWSDLLRQSSGVNTHQSYRKTVYADDAAVTALLHRTGVGFVRDKLAVNSRPQHAAFRLFRDAGIRVHSTVPTNGLNATRADIDAFMSKAVELGGASMFASFEGPNEPNADGGDWVTKTVTLMRHIRESRDAHGLSRIPLVGPALHHNLAIANGDYAKLAAADVSRFSDVGGFHFYPLGRDLARRLDEVLPTIRKVYPGQPLFLTETGWNTGLDVAGAGKPVPEDVQAVYAPRALAQAFARGVRVSLYEALDDAPGTGTSAWEERFGHLAACSSLDSATWREKPALRELRRLLTACADPGPEYRPAPLSASISAPSDVRKLVLGKRDGSYLVLLWRDVDVYDPVRRVRVDGGTRTVKIVRARRTQSVAVGSQLVVVRV